MEFYSVIEKRRTFRDFSSKPIPQDKVKKILETGLKAPTYNHLREWDFILITDKSVLQNMLNVDQVKDDYSKEELQKVFNGYEEAAKQMYFNALPKQKKMILNAPEVIVVVYKPKTKITDCKRIYDLNCLASIWCCIENMLLSMAEEDLFGVTFVPQHTENLKSILSIPYELEIAAIIPFGYRSDKAKEIKQKRVNLEDRIHYNKW